MFENLLNLFGLGGSDASAPFGFLPPAEGNDAYYWNRFNTTLSLENEQQYQKWLAEQSLKIGRNINNDQSSYDMRGYWQQNPNIDLSKGAHFPDTYKKPSHMTFSDESIYSTPTTPGGMWGMARPSPGSTQPNEMFIPSNFNLHITPAEKMKSWFEKEAPNARLELPQPILQAAQQQQANQQGQNIMQQIMENQRRQRMMQLAQQLMQTGQNQRRRF